MDTLGATGQMLVTQAAADQYGEAMDMDYEEARRELTGLLISARRTTQPASGAEGWRVRSRSMGIDVSAQVTRDGLLAVVTHVRVRTLVAHRAGRRVREIRERGRG